LDCIYAGIKEGTEALDKGSFQKLDKFPVIAEIETIDL